MSPGINTHTYTQNGAYTAVLYKIIDPCQGNPICRAAIHREAVGKVMVYVGTTPSCTKEYVPVCASKQVYCITTPCNPVQQTYGNKCLAAADGATVIYEGQCRNDGDPAADRSCKSWYDGCNTCSRETPDSPAACTLRACFQKEPAYCSAYFGTSGNRPPVISGFSGPTTLNSNQTGTWTVNASDPENDTLRYSIEWGDTVRVWDSASMQSTALSFTQTTTFTHAYASAGTYTVTVIVRDTAGKEARTSATVRVGGQVACTMQYQPVCATPYYCLISKFAPGTYPSECMYGKTYGNRCTADAEQASYRSDGQCQSSTNPGPYNNSCTADAYQCGNGNWVGRSGPNCEFVCN